MMATLFYLFLALILLFLNAFFVLAEFAIVKLRSSQIEEMVDRGEPKAMALVHVHERLDEYLSVCQVGITFASIGLGFVGEPAIARLLQPVFAWGGAAQKGLSHGAAIGVAYFLISYLHILVGELIPKSIAIRSPERSAGHTLTFLRVAHFAFLPTLWILNSSANYILHLFGFSREVKETQHSEDELRIILARSQARGLMSFRRLLLLENVFDLGEMRVRNIMRPKDQVGVLQVEAPYEENFQKIVEAKFSRFPLVDRDLPKPLGIVHVKDLLLLGLEGLKEVDLRKVVRPYVTTTPLAKVEDLLALMQRRRLHVGVVVDEADRWVGFVTLEDLAEQVLGAVEDEFAKEPMLNLAEILSVNRIILRLKGESMAEVLIEMLSRAPREELPLAPEVILQALLDREQAVSTDLGQGLAIPHARLKGLERPVLLLGRTEKGIKLGTTGRKRIYLFFVLLTPADQPQMQLRFLSRIAHLLESDYVEERLRKSSLPQEILEAIQAGETAS